MGTVTIPRIKVTKNRFTRDWQWRCTGCLTVGFETTHAAAYVLGEAHYILTHMEGTPVALGDMWWLG